MPARAYWKGYLKLSLVSCPIALYPASSSSEKVSFNRINKKTGNRLKQQNVDSVTGEPVEREDIGRGYEVAKGQYIQVEDEEIAGFAESVALEPRCLRPRDPQEACTDGGDGHVGHEGSLGGA